MSFVIVDPEVLGDDPTARRRSAMVMSSAFGLLALVVVALPRLVG